MYTKMECKREFPMKLFDDPRLSGENPKSDTLNSSCKFGGY